MSFIDVLQTAQALALADKLQASEISVYEDYCRRYSQKFYTPLLEVMALDPAFVIKMVYADQLSDWDKEERIDDLRDLLGHLSDPDYDQKKEQAIRDEMRRIVEDEADRVRTGRSIHKSLEKKVIKSFEEATSENTKPEAEKLPSQGGLNFEAIRRLNNSENEG